MKEDGVIPSQRVETLFHTDSEPIKIMSTQKASSDDMEKKIVLPDKLDTVPRATELPRHMHRWNTNEEVASILIAFDKHKEWESKEVPVRPPSGSIFLYSRKKVRYRKDSYCWKKRKDGKTTREDHMKLKVQGIECIYGCYVHSAILPTFHRRCYWLLQNPDTVLVHYLNVPLTDDNKLGMPTLSCCSDNKEWTEEELVLQLRPMFASMRHFDPSVVTEHLMEETIRHMVSQLIKDAPTTRTQECVCAGEHGSCKGLCSQKCRSICPKNAASMAPGPSSVQSRLLSYIKSTQKTSRLSASSNTMNLPQVTPEVTCTSSVTSKEGHLINSTVLLNSGSVMGHGSSRQVAPSAPLILNLSQLQGNNGLIILSGHTSSPISIINNNLTTVSSAAESLVTSAPESISTQNLATAVTFSTNNGASQSVKSKPQQTVNNITIHGQSTVLGQQEPNQSQGLLQGQGLIQVQGHIQDQGELQHQRHLQDQRKLQTEGPDTGQRQAQQESSSHTLNPDQGQGHSQDSKAQFVNQNYHGQNAVNLQNVVMDNSDVGLGNSYPNLASCDMLKSEDQDSLVSLLHPHSNKDFPHLIGSGVGLGSTSIEDMVGTGHDSQHQDMDTSLNMLHSALLELSGNANLQTSPTCTGTPDLHQPGEVSATVQDIHIKNHPLSLIDEHLQPASTESTFSNLITSQVTNSVATDTATMTTVSSPCNMEGLETHQAGDVSPQSPDLSLDNFDILDLPDFDMISHLSSTFPAPAVSLNPNEPASIASVTTPSSPPCTSTQPSHSSSISAPMPIPAPSAQHMQSQAVTMTTSTHSSRSVASQKLPVMPISCISCKHEPGSSHAGIANITDFSPEWSYAEGNSKVLVTGPWYSTTSPYTVLFDGVPVSATLVQSGVLRCYCPPHEPGLVTLQVACEGFIISNSCVFDYRASQPRSKPADQWFSLTDNELKTELIRKLGQIGKCVDDNIPANIQNKCQLSLNAAELELNIIDIIHDISQCNWIRDDVTLSGSLFSLTLLHLVAALGFERLVAEIIRLRHTKPCLLLQHEVDGLSQDDQGCTPLMWACVKGHTSTAILLYQWNSEALNIGNKNRTKPLEAAQQYGHDQLVQQIHRLSSVRENGGSDDVVRSDAAMDSNVLMPGDVSQALAVERFAVPRARVRQKGSEQGRVNCSATVTAWSATRSNSTENLTIEIPSSPPHHVGLEKSRPFCSAQNTPKTQHQTDVGMSLSSVFVGSTDILCGQNLSSVGRRSRLMKRTSVEVLPDFPLADILDNAKCTKTEPNKETSKSMQNVYYEPQATDSLAAKSSGEPSHNETTSHIADAESELLSDMPSPGSTPVTMSSVLLHSASSDPHIPMVDTDTSARDMDGNPLKSGDGRSNSCADPMISMCDRDLNSPLMFLHMDSQHGSYETGLTLNDIHQESVVMETDSPRSSSPTCLSVQMDDGIQQDKDNQMITLANQIIAAMPEHIKYSPGPSDELQVEEVFLAQDRRSSYGSYSSSGSAATPPCAEDSGISTPLEGMAFEEYRYPDLGTPTSSLSPGSSCLQSPYSCFSIDSPPPTTEEFTEYFNAPSVYMEKDFSQLTLSDEEQRRLYEAAKIIQNFYRRYKDRKELQQKQWQKEMEAAILIQSYYRRYKQYIYYKKMTQAAVRIQSQFRSYYAQKLFKKSREAATIIQNRYRAYKEHERFKKSRSAMIQQRYRSHYQRKVEGSLGDKASEMMEDSDLNSEETSTEKVSPASGKLQKGKSSNTGNNPNNSTTNIDSKDNLNSNTDGVSNQPTSDVSDAPVEHKAKTESLVPNTDICGTGD